ncbi:hypothetical protein LNP24_04540 [Klebsiella pneumoniae subsp. pneumoniae]|nr:hypothetical protein [Klebsiella pneumoniae subsp. pneumoniae]
MNRLPLYGSKHHVVMIEQLRMAIMSEQAFRGTATAPQMTRQPCQVQGFFMGTKRQADRPAGRRLRLLRL